MKPIIYQILPRLWGRKTNEPVKNGTIESNGCGKFSDIDNQSLDYFKSLGVTHVWYTGIIRHSTQCDTNGCTASSKDFIKGNAGSPYSISDYFDVNPYLAENPQERMAEFEDLVKRTHEAGLKVIIDFVPNHLSRDYGAFSPMPVINGRDADGHPVFGAGDDVSVHWKAENDFFYYPGQDLVLPVENQTYREIPAKASGNVYSPAPGINDWYDTIKLNYCDFHTSTWDKMAEVLKFWIAKGVDGFRCDMVELVPQSFLKWLISEIKNENSDTLFIAEIYRKESYSGYIYDIGFDYLYDKSGLYDALHDIVTKNVNDNGSPVEMWQSTRRITGNWQFLGGMQQYMLNFLENHDEVRFASDFFGKDAGKAKAPLAVSLLLNTAPFMIYFGQEIGERGMDEEGLSNMNGRTSIFDWWRIDSISRLYDYIHGENTLNESELRVLAKYRELLNLATSEEAFSQGGMYDLCYCNLSSDGFNQDKHFAFLRYFEQKLYLIAANFSDNQANINLTIPTHAFEWLGLPETDKLNHNNSINLVIYPFDCAVIELN